MTRSRPGSPTGTRGFDGLRLISLLRFGKALLVLATSYGLYRLLDPALVMRLQNWVLTLTDSNERHLLLHALTWYSGVNIHAVKFTVAATGAYTVLLLIEGTGLWLHRRWAEWVTVVSTSALIPFELWELVIRPPGKRVAVLAAFVLNVMIVVYLIVQLRSAAARRRSK